MKNKRILAIIISILVVAIISVCFVSCKDTEEKLHSGQTESGDIDSGDNDGDLPSGEIGSGDASEDITKEDLEDTTFTLDGITYLVNMGMAEINRVADNGQREITIPAQVEYKGLVFDIRQINSSAFADTAFDKVILSEGIEKLNDYAFAESYVHNVILPDTLESIGKYAFMINKNIVSIDIPDSVTVLGKGAFYGCSALESITLPDSVRSLANCIFEGCVSLKNISLPNINYTTMNQLFNAYDGEKEYKVETVEVRSGSIYSRAFSSFSVDEVILGKDVNSIDERSFQDNSTLTKVHVKGNIDSVKKEAFENCTALESIQFDGIVKVLEVSAFSGCIKLESLVFNDGLTEIKPLAFYGCKSLRNVVIPATVETIDITALAECEKLDVLYIPESVNTITKNYITSDNIKTILRAQAKSKPDGWDSNALYGITVLWDGDNDGGMTEEGTIYASDGKFDYLLQAPYAVLHSRAFANDDENIVIPETVEYQGSSYSVVIIKVNAFSDDEVMKSVTVPQSVKYIGEDAFNWCKNLTEVNMYGVEEICMGAFEHCVSLAEIELPATLKDINQRAFAYTALTSVTIPAATHNITSDVFENCDNLQEIIFEDPTNWRYCEEFIDPENIKEVYMNFTNPVSPEDFYSPGDTRFYYNH